MQPRRRPGAWPQRGPSSYTYNKGPWLHGCLTQHTMQNDISTIREKLRVEMTVGRDVSFSLQCSEILVFFFRKFFCNLKFASSFYITWYCFSFFLKKSFRASLRIYVCERSWDPYTQIFWHIQHGFGNNDCHCTRHRHHSLPLRH
jgi:hypothetical protein